MSEISKVVRVPLPLLESVLAQVSAYNAKHPRRGVRRVREEVSKEVLGVLHKAWDGGLHSKVVPEVPGVTVAEAVPVCQQCGRPGSNKTPGSHHYPNCVKFTRGE